MVITLKNQENKKSHKARVYRLCETIQPTGDERIELQLKSARMLESTGFIGIFNSIILYYYFRYTHVERRVSSNFKSYYYFCAVKGKIKPLCRQDSP